jgi:hypothetical protein
MNIKVIACEIARKELEILLGRNRKNKITVCYMPRELHQYGKDRMASEIQKAIDETDPHEFNAIALVYGLCNNGIVNLHGTLPIVIPRAHDCITLFMGSKERYSDYNQKNPGTYFVAGCFGMELDGQGAKGGLDYTKAAQQMRQEYAEKFGEENADYLMEMLGDPLKNYCRITFINSGLGDLYAMKENAKDAAASRNWMFDEYPGNLSLIEKLLDSEWNEDEYLVLKPGEKVTSSYNNGIIAAI